MRKVLYLTALCFTLLLASANVMAGSKDDAHVAYVLKTMKLKSDVQAKVKPVLVEYYKELATAKAPRKALKDKLGEKEDAGKLTEAECDQLFEAKQKQEAAELALKKKYYAKFKAVLTPMQAFNIVKLLGDKVK